jgi:hypothetical protein
VELALLLTNAYQVHHYRHLLPHLPESTSVVVEVRDEDLGVDEALIATYFPGLGVEWVLKSQLASLDGHFDVIVCQTPILPMQFLRRTRTVALQYSLAKERYQYGVWRSHVDLNLMYGPYSLEKVERHCNARAVGNLLFDTLGGKSVRPPVVPSRRPRVLLLPTYGELSALDAMLQRIDPGSADVTVKLHHREVGGVAAALPRGVRLVSSSVDPIQLILDSDLVVSDFSGAAYDAVACRRPVLLAGVPDSDAGDAARLSKIDVERALLTGLAVEWPTAVPFAEAFGEALELAGDDERHARFVTDLYVNFGSAAAAAADAIAEAGSLTRSHHPVGGPVHEALARHITANRELHAENASLKRRIGAAPRRPVLTRFIDLKASKRHVKGVLKRIVRTSPSLERAAIRILASRRRRRFERVVAKRAGSGREPEERSRRRRYDHAETRPPRLVEATLAAFRGSGVTIVQSPVAHHVYAVSASEPKRTLRALGVLGAEVPETVLTVKLSERRRVRRSADLITLNDVVRARSIEIRRDAVDGPGSGQRVVIQFVTVDRRTKRVIAVDGRAQHFDWTLDFIDVGDGVGAEFGDETSRMRLVETAAPSRGLAQRGFGKPIDVVYTWVDSSDPVWQERRARYRRGEQHHLPSAANDERYLDRDELRYSLRSVELHASFVRNVYVVTDGHVPAWLALDHPRIKVVDHRNIFPDSAVLPVFNSHAIEACLHRIDGLAEHYLYMNDDFFFGDDVTADDFFTENDLIKVHLSPSQFVYDGEPPPHAIPTDWASYQVKRRIECEFGYLVRYRLKHLAYAQRRSIAQEIEDRYPEVLARTRASRFRAKTDLAFPSMFLPYYALATQRAVAWPNAAGEYTYADTGRLNWYDRARLALKNRPRFICLNATRYDQIPLEQQYRNVTTFLATYFPRPSSMERTDESREGDGGAT